MSNSVTSLRASFWPRLLVCLCLLSHCGALCSQKLHLQADNIDEIIRSMHYREKVQLIVGDGWGSLFDGFNIPLCHGQVPGAAGQTRAIPRLGIPSLILADGPAGLRLKKTLPTTGFPVGTSLAASNDTALVEQVGRAIAEEALHYGVDVVLTPGMNVMRNPLCGRNYEYFSEDPVLTARMASAIVRGVQSQGIGACIKHFACNNQEYRRFKNDVRVDTATLHNIYLAPFLEAIRQSQPWTLMSSYNLINGERTQESRYLLTDVLRRQWGYDGVVMTDWTGVRRTPQQVYAGNDMLMPGMKHQRVHLYGAIRVGRLSESVVDSAIHRILSLVVRTERFRHPEATCDLKLREHAALSRKAAAMGMVVLENHVQTLPLSFQGKRVGLYGSSSYDMLTSGIGSGHVNCRYVMQMPFALQLEGARVDSVISSYYHRYLSRPRHRRPRKAMMWRFLGDGGFKEAPLDSMKIVRREPHTDVAIVTISRPSGEGRDRKVKDDFLLTENEQRLLRNVSDVYHRAGKRVVVVLNVCGPVEIASWRHLADAILVAWLPGQSAAGAVCDVLSGRVCPHSRLPMTWPLSINDLPSSRNFPSVTDDESEVTRYEEGSDIGHRYFNRTNQPVAYPFGYESRKIK